MSTFEPRECFWCGGPIYGIVYQQCNCERCGDKLQNEFCPTCNSGAGNSFAYDPNPNSFDDSQNFSDYPTHYEPILCDFCGNDARYGHYCTPQVPNPEPCYNQNYDEFPQTLPSFQQQSLCCENCGGPHATFECQPMNQNFHDSSFDQFQPPQSPVIHQPPQEMSMEALQAREDLMKSIENFLKKFNRISFQKTPKVLMQAWDKFLEIKHAQFEDLQELLNKLVDDLRNVNEELVEYTNTLSWNLPNSSYDDDDDEESSIPLKDIIMCGLPPCVAITPDSTKTDSLIMEDEHLSTIPEIESDEFIKSSVENLSHLVTFSNPLFDIDDDCTSSDDELFSEEDVPMENFKIFSNPLFDLDKEIIATEVNLIQNEVLESITLIPPGINSFDAESNLIESLLNRNTSIDSSSKIDSLLDEFAGELTLLRSIPLGIDDDNLDPGGEIYLVERLLYDNSSPRPPEELNVENSIESFSPSPIPVEDSDSLMEEIDLFLISDNSMLPSIENDDCDSEGDILFLEELLSNNSPSLPENESFHFDIPSSPCPIAKSPDDGIYFEPDTGLLTTKVVGDISEHYVLMPKLLPTQPTLCPVNDTLIPFSSENEDKVHLLSHRGFKAFQLFSESPMMIYGGDIPLFDVLFLHFYPP
ncbi:hypothetical protein Tco_1348373 [Tanacetum coccineum]